KIGLTFTEIKSPEDCSILMYRDNVADLYLSAEEIDAEYIKQADSILVSVTALSQSPSREAILLAVDIAKENNVEVIFELDYRPYTGKYEEEKSIYIARVDNKSYIILGTRGEFNVLAGYQGLSDDETVNHLFQYFPRLIVIKHGVKGSNEFTKEGEVIEG